MNRKKYVQETFELYTEVTEDPHRWYHIIHLRALRKRAYSDSSFGPEDALLFKARFFNRTTRQSFTVKEPSYLIHIPQGETGHTLRVFLNGDIVITFIKPVHMVVSNKEITCSSEENKE